MLGDIVGGAVGTLVGEPVDGDKEGLRVANTLAEFVALHWCL
jgi:hypothetical protein